MDKDPLYYELMVKLYFEREREGNRGTGRNAPPSGKCGPWWRAKRTMKRAGQWLRITRRW
ncbi:hypothetical protein [Staphylospora marina]|uniref:hypothetical protein n=1 Tax=Staphylospora marina TaxID=2490858 RepID=UPI000F5BE928|nr:hypothetical protein [Staphylospora marina]